MDDLETALAAVTAGTSWLKSPNLPERGRQPAVTSGGVGRLALQIVDVAESHHPDPRLLPGLLAAYRHVTGDVWPASMTEDEQVERVRATWMRSVRCRPLGPADPGGLQAVGRHGAAADAAAVGCGGGTPRRAGRVLIVSTRGAPGQERVPYDGPGRLRRV